MRCAPPLGIRQPLQRAVLTVACLASLGSLASAQPPAHASADAAAAAILPRTAEGLARLREVETNVAWARVRIPGQRAATLEERMAAYRVRGLSIAVIHDYRIEWAKGYGWADVAAHRRVTADTRFEPGSISKALNAAGVLSLVRDGALDLHTDVNTYLRSWRFPYGLLTKGKPITLAALLSHTAGLGLHGFWGYRPGDSLPSVPQILDGAYPANNDAVRSVHPPGVRYRYSGGGTMIAQQVVMDVTRRPYAEVMRERVLAPLGMASSFFTQPPPDSAADRLAVGYTALGTPISGRYPVMPEQAAAGLWTTAPDLARFVIDVQRALRGDPGTVVTPAQARLMTTPALADAPGLGLFLIDTAGVRYFEHGAGNVGMSGELVGSMAGGDGVVVLQNGESAELLQEVVRTVARVYAWPGLGREPAPAPATVSVPSSTLDRYVGHYRQGDVVISVARSGDTLWLLGPGAPSRIFFTSPTTFFNQESSSQKRFLLDSVGRATALVLLAKGEEAGRARRVTPISLRNDVMRQYAGVYRDTRGDTVRLAARDRALWLESAGAVRRAHFASPTEFFTMEDFGIGYRVAATASGLVTGIWQSFGGERFFWRRESR